MNELLTFQLNIIQFFILVKFLWNGNSKYFALNNVINISSCKKYPCLYKNDKNLKKYLVLWSLIFVIIFYLICIEWNVIKTLIDTQLVKIIIIVYPIIRGKTHPFDNINIHIN